MCARLRVYALPSACAPKIRRLLCLLLIWFGSVPPEAAQGRAEAGPVNIDELTGRELDARVAQHVFGYEVEPGVNIRTDEKDYFQRTLSGRDWVRVAFYSRNMGASLEVELALRDRGWTRTEPLVGAPGDVRVVLEHADGRTVESFGPMSVALCRAALKAVTP